jgi:hypothetical protein
MSHLEKIIEESSIGPPKKCGALFYSNKKILTHFGFMFYFFEKAKKLVKYFFEKPINILNFIKAKQSSKIVF